MFLIAEEHNTEKQIDRACAAQSPEMLPTDKVNGRDIEAAKDRVQKFKDNALPPEE